MDNYHIGRSWSGNRLEKDCPCVNAACGLVSIPSEDCDQHHYTATKTMRQIHDVDNCPGNPNG